MLKIESVRAFEERESKGKTNRRGSRNKIAGAAVSYAGGCTVYRDRTRIYVYADVVRSKRERGNCMWRLYYLKKIMTGRTGNRSRER